MKVLSNKRDWNWSTVGFTSFGSSFESLVKIYTLYNLFRNLKLISSSQLSPLGTIKYENALNVHLLYLVRRQLMRTLFTVQGWQSAPIWSHTRATFKKSGFLPQIYNKPKLLGRIFQFNGFIKLEWSKSIFNFGICRWKLQNLPALCRKFVKMWL